MVDQVYAAVYRAIVQRDQNEATYHGKIREMCPHVLGDKDKRPKALFYQFGGESDKGLAPQGSPDNWRCIFLDELSKVSVRPGVWYTSVGYSAERQGCVKENDIAVGQARRRVR